MVHAVNFVLFVGALAAFQFLLSGTEEPPRDRSCDCALMGIGYSAFLYTTMDFVSLGMVTPDLWWRCSYLAAAFLFRIQREPDRMWNYYALGLSWGWATWQNPLSCR